MQLESLGTFFDGILHMSKSLPFGATLPFRIENQRKKCTRDPFYNNRWGEETDNAQRRRKPQKTKWDHPGNAALGPFFPSSSCQGHQQGHPEIRQVGGPVASMSKGARSPFFFLFLWFLLDIPFVWGQNCSLTAAGNPSDDSIDAGCLIHATLNLSPGPIFWLRS